MIPILIAAVAAAYLALKKKNGTDSESKTADEERQNRAAALGTPVFQRGTPIAPPKAAPTPAPRPPTRQIYPIGSRRGRR